MNTARLLVCCALCAALVAASEPGAVKVHLYAVNGSGEHGMATLTPLGTDLIVTVAVIGEPRGGSGQFAHLHRGTCEHVASPTLYVLQPIRNGHSTTRLTDIGLEALVHGTYSLLIHQTRSPASAHVACGTISGA